MQVRAGCELALETGTAGPLLTMLAPRAGGGHWRVNARRWGPEHDFSEFTDAFGNRCQRFLVPAGHTTIRFETEATATVPPAPNADAVWIPPAQLPPEALQFLLPSRYCPSDRAELYQLARLIVGDATPGAAQVGRISDWIAANLAYRAGVSNAHTDAQDTIRDGAGVCRDFAHVGIALCRTLDIPARMVVGWLHELKPMDLHAWFEAWLGDGWHTVDPTQTTAHGARVVIGHGRDAADVAFLTSFSPLTAFSIRVWTDRAEAA